MWYVLAKQTARDGELDRRIKGLIHRTPFFRKLFGHFNVPMTDLVRVRFKGENLKDEYSANRGDEIFIDERMLQQPIDEVIALVAHELTHWLTAQRRRGNSYLSDPEEREAFVWGIAYEMSRGKTMEEIVAKYQPIIEQGCEPGQASQLLVKLITKARSLK